MAPKTNSHGVNMNSHGFTQPRFIEHQGNHSYIVRDQAAPETNTHGFTRVRTDSIGFTRLSHSYTVRGQTAPKTDTLGFTRVHADSRGFTRFLMDSYRLIRIHTDSHGFTRIHTTLFH